MQKWLLAFALVFWFAKVSSAQVEAPLELNVITSPDRSFILTDQKLVRITGMAGKRKNQNRITISLREPKQITILGDCK